MADVQEQTTADPTVTPKKTKTEPAKKTKTAKAKPTHPPTSDMVNAAIKNLKERGGSSLQAIKKYITANYKVDAEKMSIFIRKYLKTAVLSGTLVQTKGKGASGSFKLAADAKATKAAPVAAKKPTRKAVTKKATTAAKAKKAAAVEKKTTTTVAKAKKTVVEKKAVASKTAKPKSPSKAKKTTKAPTKKPKAPKPKTAKKAAPKATKKTATPKKK